MDFKLNIIIRWIARIIGTLIALLMFAFAFGEGMPNPFSMTMRENLMFGGFFIILAGLVIALWREILGSVLIFIGWLFFWGINIFTSGVIWMGWFLFIYPILGGLYLYCGITTRKNRK